MGCAALTIGTGNVYGPEALMWIAQSTAQTPNICKVFLHRCPTYPLVHGELRV